MKNLIDQFITIPTWKVTGLVINERPAAYGTDDAVEVLVQAKPDDPNPRWYHLEPNEYSVEEL